MIWKNEKRRLDDLKPATYNPRRISKKQKVDLEASLDRFDLVDPIIINADGTIIGGHQRYAILKAKGCEEVDCRVPEFPLSIEQEKELNLRLNKNQGEFDLGLLTAFDPEMLVGAGFEGSMVDELFQIESKEDDYDVNKAVESIKEPKTFRGDVYVFPGGHRLMCGSSTEYGDIEKLMEGQKADLVYTDPPYNVAYKGKAGIKNDDQSDEEFAEFLGAAFVNAYAFTNDHANFYCWFAMSNYSHFRAAIEKAGWRYMQVINWMKDRFALSRGWYYHRLTEPCMIAYKDWNKKYTNNQYAKNHDVWQMDKLTFEENLDVWYQQRDQSKDYMHPTQKPIRLGERALKKNSEVGHIVLDMFCGGGSTLLCAHQLKRVCYAMELDERYCDVIVDRFQKMTGLEVKRL